MTIRRLLFAFLLVSLCPYPQFCQGGIVRTQGSVLIIAAPPSVAKSQLTSDTATHLFVEQSSLTLGQDVTVDVTATGIVDTADDLTPGSILTGSVVDSYLLSANKFSPGRGVFQYSGEVTFDVLVLGVIVTGDTLDATDAILGADITSYLPSNAFRGFDGPTFSASPSAFADLLEISADRRTVSFDFRTGIFNDQIRIITAAVPEPTSITLALFCAVVLIMQAHRKKCVVACGDRGQKNRLFSYRRECFGCEIA